MKKNCNSRRVYYKQNVYHFDCKQNGCLGKGGSEGIVVKLLPLFDAPDRAKLIIFNKKHR